MFTKENARFEAGAESHEAQRRSAGMATYPTPAHDAQVSELKSESSADTDQHVSRDERFAMAEQFLSSLDEEAEVFTFQTFTDTKQTSGPDPLAKIRHGSLDDCWD